MWTDCDEIEEGVPDCSKGVMVRIPNQMDESGFGSRLRVAGLLFRRLTVVVGLEGDNENKKSVQDRQDVFGPRIALDVDQILRRARSDPKHIPQCTKGNRARLARGHCREVVDTLLDEFS
jgi:hypothetical protein